LPGPTNTTTLLDVKFRHIPCLLLITFATTVHAQVRELWRGGLKNNQCLPGTTLLATFIRLTAATLDRFGNTIIGGSASVFTQDFQWLGDRAFIVKVDPFGNNLWTYTIGTNAWNGVQTIATDSEGNVLFTTQPVRDSTLHPMFLIKLSPDGEVMWSATEDYFFTSDDRATAALRVDAQDNVVVTAFLCYGYETGRAVAKFDSAGNRLWRSLLPPRGYLLAYDLSESLVLTADGRVALVGLRETDRGSGFITQLDSSGQIEWWTDQYKGKETLSDFNSVLVSPKGSICAANPRGFTVFNATGHPLHTGTPGAEFATLLPDDGFLLYSDSYLQALDATGGRVRWAVGLPFWPALGVLPDKAGGCLAAGEHTLGGTSIYQVAAGGRQISRIALPDSDFAPAPGNSFLQAPDGSLRLITQAAYYVWGPPDGIRIIALPSVQD
jgi:outer membrane protein assembly factor BamB